ncbi:MAG TPA: Crp/Fnr family transcriptional regulator [Rhodocyclaceae bacterium]
MSGPSLNDSALFETIPAADLTALAARVGTRKFPKQSVIVHEGDRADALYVILAGSVEFILQGEDGRRFVLGTAGAGEYFGEMMLDGGPRSASVVAVEACQCAVIPGAEMQLFVERHPAVALTIMRNLSRRVRTLTERVKSLALMDVYGRVAALLLEVRQADGGVVLSQQDIANRVGASRQMVSRIINDLLDGGYIARAGRRYVILGPLPRAW